MTNQLVVGIEENFDSSPRMLTNMFLSSIQSPLSAIKSKVEKTRTDITKNNIKAHKASALFLDQPDLNEFTL
jgi:hypothetical protein